MPHVLFLPKWYPNKTGLTDGIFIRRHAEAVSQQGSVEVEVLFATPEEKLAKGNFYYCESRLVAPHLKETIFYYKKELTKIGFIDRGLKLILYFFCMWRGYRSIQRSHRPDILHVHVLLRNGLAALLFSRARQIPIVYTEHWSGYHSQDGNYKGWIRKLLTEFFISRVNCIMPVTQHLAMAMQQHGLKGNYEIVPNVVNSALFTLGKQTPPPNEVHAIHISNFDPRAKNINGLLEVMGKIMDSHPKVRLKIVGNGPNQGFFEQKALSLGLLGKTVFFVGQKFGLELIQLLQSADFLFLFSHFENQPCVIMEAMACGKPILATQVGGIPEMVDGSRGILSVPDDVEQMVKCMESILDRLPSYDPEKIRQFAVDQYSYQTVGLQLLHVYQKAIKKS